MRTLTVSRAQAQFLLVRSVRHKPAVVPNQQTIVQRKPGSMSDTKWRKGFQLLQQYGLSFDLQAPWWHFGEAIELEADFPDTLIIFNHTGLPADQSIDGINGWRAMMEQLAEQPNWVSANHGKYF